MANYRLSSICRGFGAIDYCYQIAIISAFFFFVGSVIVFITNPDSLSLIILPTVLWIIGSAIACIFFVRARRVLEPLFWYTIGSMVFFGVGVGASLIKKVINGDEYLAYHFGTGFDYLINVNLLNSSSVLIVLSTGVLFMGKEALVANNNFQFKNKGGHSLLRKLYPILMMIASVAVVAKYMFFPIADDLIIRSLLDKIYYFLPTLFLLFPLLMDDLKRYLVVLFVVIFFLVLFCAIMSFNKFEMLTPILSLLLGLFLRGVSIQKISFVFLLIPLFYVLINPMFVMARSHSAYEPNKNTLADRVGIISDLMTPSSTSSTSSIGGDLSKNKALKESFNSYWMSKVASTNITDRFDIVSTQGFLINEYKRGKKGVSLDDFWLILIPRILWPEKPVMTSVAGELNSLFFMDPENDDSSMAPSYSGEMFWNYGAAGVVIISIYLGLVFGFFSRCAFRSTQDPAYFFIAYPMLFTAVFVESWVASTYVAGIVIAFIYYFLIKFMLKKLAAQN